MSFKKNGYEIVENVLTKDVVDFISTEFGLLSDMNHIFDNLEVEKFGYADTQVNNSFPMYSPIFGETLLLKLKEKVELIVDKKLSPTYSYGRIYYPGAKMDAHTDRPPCEYSVSLTLGVEGKVWPIFFKDRSGTTKEIIIEPGSMVVYSGCELVHWRETCSNETKKQYQVFLHYVDSNGPNQNCIYDGRKFLGFPKQ